MGKANAARLVELSSLMVFSLTGASLYIVWEIVPSVVAVIAFLTYTQALGTTEFFPFSFQLCPVCFLTSITVQVRT